MVRADRVRVASGSFTVTLKRRVEAGFPGLNQTANASFALSLPWGAAVSFDGLVRYTDGGPRVGWDVSATALAGETPVTDRDGYPEPHADDIPITGSFEVWIDADIVHVRDTDVAADADGFPTYGGPVSRSFPFATHSRFYRTTRPGGTAYATITATDGTVTVTATQTATITTRAELGDSTIAYPYDVGKMQLWADGAVRVTEFSSSLAASWEYGHGVTTDHQFLQPSIDYTRTNGGGAATVTASSMVLAAIDTATGGASDAAASLLVQPSKALHTVGAIRFIDGAASGSFEVERLAAGSVDGTITAGSAWADDATLSGGCWVISTLDGAAQTDLISATEWNRLSYRLSAATLTANDLNTDEWRLLVHTMPWQAVSIAQASGFEIDPCTALTVSAGHYAGVWSRSAGGVLTIESGGHIAYTVPVGGGTLTRSFTDPAGVSGYRYLSLLLQASSGGQAIGPVTIGAKQWIMDPAGDPLTPGTTTALLWLDLCGPTNMTAEVDALDSRWPATGSMPTDDDHVDGDGAMWGVQRVRGAITWTFPAACAGITYILSGLGMGHYGPGTQSDLTLQSAGGWWLFSDVTTPGGVRTETWIKPFLFGDTDGRFSLEECHAEKIIVTPPVGPATTTYLSLPIWALVDKINAVDESWPTGTATVTENALRNCGWSAAYAGTCDSPEGADWSAWLGGDLNKYREGVLLGGAGGVYAVWDGEPGWRWSWDMHRVAGSSDTDYAQWLCDEIGFDPGLGDLFGLTTDADAEAGELHVACKRITNGRAWGLVLEGDCTPNTSAVGALLRGTANRGTGATGSEGEYRTAIPGGKGDVVHTVECRTGAEPYLTSSAEMRLRYSRRRCFRRDPAASNALSYDVTDALRHARGTIRDGRIAIEAATTLHPTAWAPPVVTSIQADDLAIRWDRSDSRQALLIAAAHGGAITLHRTYDEGRSTEAMASIMTGSHPEIMVARGGGVYIYGWVSGSIHGVIYDAQGNELVPEFVAVSGGVDDADIACDEYVVDGGEWHIALIYRSSGVLTTVTSADGRTFA